jgi:hypothetical protein
MFEALKIRDLLPDRLDLLTDPAFRQEGILEPVPLEDRQRLNLIVYGFVGQLDLIPICSDELPGGASTH